MDDFIRLSTKIIKVERFVVFCIKKVQWHSPILPLSILTNSLIDVTRLSLGYVGKLSIFSNWSSFNILYD